MDMGRTCSRDTHIVSLCVLRKLESRFCVWWLSLSSTQQRAGDIVTSQNGWMPSRARPRGSEPGHMLVAFFATLQLSKMHPNKKNIRPRVSYTSHFWKQVWAGSKSRPTTLCSSQRSHWPRLNAMVDPTRGVTVAERDDGPGASPAPGEPGGNLIRSFMGPPSLKRKI